MCCWWACFVLSVVSLIYQSFTVYEYSYRWPESIWTGSLKSNNSGWGWACYPLFHSLRVSVMTSSCLVALDILCCILICPGLIFPCGTYIEHVVTKTRAWASIICCVLLAIIFFTHDDNAIVNCEECYACVLRTMTLPTVFYVFAVFNLSCHESSADEHQPILDACVRRV
eukprot:TRINITY_DN62436_c0_g1_i1.p1 TRINITY_DN62436_c0_g1~~TRINITY_DN62436_c0_g1_i1.p1  ORF type:complete len:170 (-),score=17.95 TRINITY_DN62436_c0_g1_i1:215-724(-)